MRKKVVTLGTCYQNGRPTAHLIQTSSNNLSSTNIALLPIFFPDHLQNSFAIIVKTNIQGIPGMFTHYFTQSIEPWFKFLSYLHLDDTERIIECLDVGRQSVGCVL